FVTWLVTWLVTLVSRVPDILEKDESRGRSCAAPGHARLEAGAHRHAILALGSWGDAMRTGAAGWLAWSLVALPVALGPGALPPAVALTRAASTPAPSTPLPPQAVAQLQLSAPSWQGLLGTVVLAWVFAALGALLVARSPAPALGWLFCALGVE